MTDLLALGFIDTFRELYPNKDMAYTYWSYIANARKNNVGWYIYNYTYYKQNNFILFLFLMF